MRVIETSLEDDLSLFSRYLWQKRVRHRIFEERGRQVVELADPESADPVRKAYQDWRAGSLVLESKAAAPSEPRDMGDALKRGLLVLRRYPVLVILGVIAVIVYPFASVISTGELTAVAAYLTIIDLRQPAEPVVQSLLHGELWRWVTPIFLHFSVVHLLFNLAVTTDFGRRIETGRGSIPFLLIVVLIAIASNLGQFLISGNPVFGGLSGVAYGLLGYVLMSQRRFPDVPIWQVHAGFAWSLLIFLVIFSSGITEPFGLYIANAAHWVGLIAGALLAWLIPLPQRSD